MIKRLRLKTPKKRLRRLNKLNWVWEKVGKDGSTTIDGYYSSLRSALVCGLDDGFGGSDTKTILKAVRQSTEEVLEAFHAALADGSLNKEAIEA